MTISMSVKQGLMLCALGLSLGVPSIAVAQDTGAHVAGMTGNTEAGRQEYRRFCVGCHGEEGNGQGNNAQWLDVKPRDFTEALFRWRSTPTGTLPTDQDIYDTITRGVVGTFMPTWSPLAPQTRVDLVAYIKTFSPKWQTQKAGTPIPIPPEPAVTIEGVLHGRELFDKMQCWKCHGPEGRGDGPSAITLTDDKGEPIRPYNFHDGTRFRCGETNKDLYKIFMTGLDGSPMPSFAGVIEPKDAWDLAHFLRTLQPRVQSQSRELWLEYVKTHKDIKPIGVD